MKKTLTIVCLLGWLATDLRAQNSVVAAGGNASGSGGMVSYSVGQPANLTKTGSGGTLTEGVQQPYEIFTVTGISEASVQVDAVVFPNPTSDYIELRLDNASNESFNYALFNLSGRTIEQSITSGNVTKINMAALPNGVYYLEVFTNSKSIKSFQINKCN